MDSLQVINNLKKDDDEHKKFKYDDNSSSSSSNNLQNFQNGKEFKLEDPVSEEASEGEESVDLYEEAFANRTTPVMTDDDDSKPGGSGEVKKIGEIIGNIQLTSNVADKPPTSPLVGPSNQDQPPASPIAKDVDMDHPPASPIVPSALPTVSPASPSVPPENIIIEPEILDPTKLQIRKINFNEYKQYFESLKAPVNTTLT
jgi:hypothetical protein